MQARLPDKCNCAITSPVGVTTNCPKLVDATWLVTWLRSLTDRVSITSNVFLAAFTIRSSPGDKELVCLLKKELVRSRVEVQ